MIGEDPPLKKVKSESSGSSSSSSSRQAAIVKSERLTIDLTNSE